MKRRDFLNSRKKSPTELLAELSLALQKRKALQFNLALGKVKNQKELKEVKKTIARLKTLLKEKETSPLS